jgi:2-isopropylmalate synthase
MKDHIIENTRAGGIAFWEEVARDGAQSKTIMNGIKRAYFANKHARLFNGSAEKHLIFAAGFPSAGKNEFEAVKILANNVDSCYLATHARPTRYDIDLSIEAIRDAKYPRLSFLLPTTEEKAQTIMKCSLTQAHKLGLELIEYTKNKAPDIPLDIALVDSPMADPLKLADFINISTEKGVGISKICDSRGLFYPNQLANFHNRLAANLSDNVNLGIHFHNDLSLALWNTISMIEKGIRITSSSWLGLGERSGLVATEQILFILLYQNAELENRFGIKSPEKLFSNSFNIKEIVGLAQELSEQLNIPIKSTDPIIGSGLNSISTGLPFSNPIEFQPFDPKEILDVNSNVMVTHMASKKVINHVAIENNYTFSDEQLHEIMGIIKEQPYDSDKPIFETRELLNIFETIKLK